MRLMKNWPRARYRALFYLFSAEKQNLFLSASDKIAVAPTLPTYAGYGKSNLFDFNNTLCYYNSP